MRLIISETVQKMFHEAVEIAKQKNHEFVTPEHLLWIMIHNSKACKLIEFAGGRIEYIESKLNTYFDNSIPCNSTKSKSDPMQSLGLQTLFDNAIDFCIEAEQKLIGFEHIFFALLNGDKNHSSYFLNTSGINRDDLLALLYSPQFYDDGSDTVDYFENLPKNPRGELFVDVRQMQKKLSNIEVAKSMQAFQEFLTGQIKPHIQREKLDFDAIEHQDKKKKRTYLNKFAINLNEKAKKGLLSPLIGREKELDRTIQILCRKQKNNPLHVGGEGVGKTAITYGLVQKIVAGDVPSVLADSTIYAISISDLIAGAKFRGDVEDRLKHILDELKNEQNAIIFIDEIQSAFDMNNGNNSDIADLLKPILNNDDVHCIGATTHKDYEKYFSANRAFSRRFQKIDIEEPSEEESLKILHGLKKSFEKFHRVRYSDEVLKAAVHLSTQHIRERFLPDKAIDIIDEVGSYLKISLERTMIEKHKPLQYTSQKNLPYKNVSIKDIDKIISKMANIPEQIVSVDETEKLKNLEKELSKKIFGQGTAITEVVKAVKRSRAGFRLKEKPVANFLFVGPTGVGKTELAKTLSNELSIPLIRFDMSEYQEKHTVSRLVGSPPGYVGFDEGGLLTDAIRKQPNTVLLLDEIEKAHKDIYNILLQIMDYATLTDTHGRKANFSNVILILTSNAGTAEIGKPIIGFAENSVSESAIDEAIEKTFTPEFRNRLDAVIKFGPLSLQVMTSIIKNEIGKLKINLDEKEIKLEIEEDVIPLLAEKGYSKEYGARNANRLVEDEFVTPLTDMILFGSAKKGDVVHCKVMNKTKKPYLQLIARHKMDFQRSDS